MVKSVLDDLAQIYTVASVPERERMAAAVEAFNRRIATDPLSVGESRSRGHRVASIALLTVWFRVDSAQLQVYVTAVARYGQ